MSLIVKICGLSTPEALDAALDERADMVGFVFFPPSPRNVSFETAKMLGARVQGRAKKVALTVDADDELLARIVEVLAPDFLQLHGKELADRSYAIKKRFGLPIIKAFAVEAKSDFAQLKAYQPIGAWLLFDAKAPAEATRPGGLGQPVDWPMIREKRPEWALTSDLGKPFDWALMSGAIPGVPVILSGGLNAGNVGEALRITRVPAVDVSSGVETSPGRKDAQKVRDFIEAARQAHLRLPPYEVLSPA